MPANLLVLTMTDGKEISLVFPFGLRGKIEPPRGILVLILLLFLNSLAYHSSFPHREYDYELYWSFSNKGRGEERASF